jgi:hypothetical protein
MAIFGYNGLRKLTQMPSLHTSITLATLPTLNFDNYIADLATQVPQTSELYALAHGFDMTMALKSTINAILGREIPTIVCTDSKSLFECITKLGTTQEKRLMIDILCLREAYERREITEFRWIAGDSNPADSMTKLKGL